MIFCHNFMDSKNIKEWQFHSGGSYGRCTWHVHSAHLCTETAKIKTNLHLWFFNPFSNPLDTICIWFISIITESFRKLEGCWRNGDNFPLPSPSSQIVDVEWMKCKDRQKNWSRDYTCHFTVESKMWKTIEQLPDLWIKSFCKLDARNRLLKEILDNVLLVKDIWRSV